MSTKSWIAPWESWKYGTVLRRRTSPDLIVMFIGMRSSTKAWMLTLADPKKKLVPRSYYEDKVWSWTAGFGGWEVVDDDT